MKQQSFPESPFGALLRDWRQKRRFSQLALGHFANVSARHVSFLETGRARPSREMVLQLADSLAMPKAEANRALHLAGFASAYPLRPHDDTDLTPVSRAITHMLESHMPYPAIALDRLWNITAANAMAQKLLQAAGFAGFGNLLQALSAQSPEESAIENWEEAIGLLLVRLQAELHTGHPEPELRALAKNLNTRFALHSTGQRLDRSKAIIPTRFLINGQTVSLFSTIAAFGSVQDMVLEDMKIELMFPVDAQSEVYFQQSAKD